MYIFPQSSWSPPENKYNIRELIHQIYINMDNIITRDIAKHIEKDLFKGKIIIIY
jgi:hypothetical protein